MALGKGTNSYVTETEASFYFNDRIDVAAWTTADSAQRDQALITATSILDDLSWVGVAMDASQPLAFPRSGSYFDPRVGTYVTLSSAVPDRIIKATCELAYHLLNNDGILDDTGLVNNLSVGSINLTTIRNPNLIPYAVKRVIKPLLANAGAHSWWRAN